MAKRKDAEIERLLRRVVKDAVKNEEAITIKLARSRVEKELGLEEGFFKNDQEWKARSKAVIEAVFQEEDEPAETVAPTPAPSISKLKSFETSKSAEKEISNTPKPQQRSEKPSTKSTTQYAASPSMPKESQPVSSVAAQDQGSSDHESEATSGDEDDDSGSTTNETQTSVHTTLKKPEKAALKVNGVKRKADDQSAADATDSKSEHEGDVQDEHQDKKAKTKSSTSDEGDSTGNDYESSDENDDDGEQEQEETQARNIQPREAINEPPIALQAIPPKPFQPPPGYTLVDSNKLRENATFSSANLDGKQIWHITAPSNLPLSSLKDMALSEIQTGTPILTRNNIDYVMHEDQDDSRSHLAILLPTKDGYERAEQKIERTLQIQQKITLPNLTVRQASQTTGSTAAGDIAQPSTTTVRPQPKGLRMRYKPPGFGPGKPGTIGSGSDSIEDDEDEQPPSKTTFQFPKALGAHGTSMGGIAGGAVTNADIQESTPTKTKKKKRKDRESVEGSQPLGNGAAASPEAHATTLAKKTVQTPASALPNGVAPESCSKEDKAQRKEERRLKRERKEAKRKAEEATS